MLSLIAKGMIMAAIVFPTGKPMIVGDLVPIAEHYNTQHACGRYFGDMPAKRPETRGLVFLAPPIVPGAPLPPTTILTTRDRVLLTIADRKVPYVQLWMSDAPYAKIELSQADFDAAKGCLTVDMIEARKT